MDILEATENWIDRWNSIPGSIFEKLASYDESIRFYASETLSLLASGISICENCGSIIDESLEQLEEDRECDNCGKSDWHIGYPQYAFPCGWGTLFSPPSIDAEWIRNNLEVVTRCGFFVFESEDYDILLGIDGGGYDFYNQHWVPLYKARGLHWHDEKDRKER